MAEDDLKLLQAVRDWKPPTTLHPIAMYAFGFYERAGFKLTNEGLEELKKVLDAYGDDLKGLAEALEGLTRFLILATTQYDDHEAGTKLTELMRSYTHLYEPFWEKVGEALQNVGTETKGSFLNF